MGTEISCPKCGEAFKIDESGYAEIVKQVRDGQFEEELNQRVELVQSNLGKELEITAARLEAEKKEALTKRDKDLQDLNSRIERMEAEKLVAVSEATGPLNNKITELEGRINGFEGDKRLAISDATSPLNNEITRLKGQLERVDSDKQLAVRDAVDPFNQKVTDLEKQLEDQARDFDMKIQRLTQEHENYVQMRKAQSTKMMGETLEEHCQNQFNLIRAAAFPNAIFEKDNTVVEGTKGDFIFRDMFEGVETVSIMFEMKNEDEATERKKKNEDHFDKLDKDRTKKKCEYAVLVSMLESDSDVYNSGIVDVSHCYEKMYVIRPQFFIPMISLLRNAALRSLTDRLELAKAREQNIDVTDFVEKLFDFKTKFAKNYDTASKHFEDAITQIDKSIKSLEATKQKLVSSQTQLRWANDKAQGLTIRKLTYNNKTMQERFSGVNEPDPE